jgi:hypothetical protein
VFNRAAIFTNPGIAELPLQAMKPAAAFPTTLAQKCGEPAPHKHYNTL